MFEIRNDIPIPSQKRKERTQPYPFGEMNVGDSFFAPFKKGSIQSYARIFAKQNNVKFRVVEMADENGVAGSRCWRIK